MKQKEPREEILELINTLNKANEEYYVDNKPSLTDLQYDVLMRRLKELEKVFPQLVHSKSPTKKVGSDLSKGFKKVKHSKPMLSIQNAMNEEELIHWFRMFNLFKSV